MQNENFPKIFRKEQIEDFVLCSKDASSFQGPGGDIVHDEHIEMILEEVKASETDLSSARIAIEKYIETELIKDPDNVLFMRMSDAFRSIIQKVIDIEVKMFGQPKYVFTRQSGTPEAYRMDGGAETAISSVNLPQDVLTEVAKYRNFTVSEPSEYILPDAPKTVMDRRRKFFEMLPTTEDPIKTENEWQMNFRREALYEFFDRVLFISNFHDQVSMFITEQLANYAIKGEVLGFKRDEQMLEYEQECVMDMPELVPGEFIHTAADSSKRALYILLHLSGPHREAYTKYVNENIDHLREVYLMPADEMDGDTQLWDDNYVVESSIDNTFRALVALYGKHAITAHDLTGLKFVVKFIQQDAEDQLAHVYLFLNDYISYYEERHFHESAANCEELKTYISELQPQPEEPSEEEVQTMNEEAQEARSLTFTSGVLIQ